jgi:hypothetical protein
MAELRPWHHYFGLSLTDFFQGTGARVETEKDVSHHKQLLDFVIVLPKDAGPPPRRLPDGFEDLGRYNLVTFKSYQEALSGEALNELIGHYANFKKQVDAGEALAESDFRLFAVCIRSPHNLIQQNQLRLLRPGVYEARHFTGFLRVVVVHDLPKEEHNAMLLLFSAKKELMEYGALHYQPYSVQTNTLLLNLIRQYRQEELPMPETLDELARRTIDQLLESLPPEKRLEGLPAEELRKRLSPEERIEGLSPEKRLEGLPAEELRKRLSPEERIEGLSPEERLKGLSPEDREILLRLLRGNGTQTQED